MHRLFGLCQYFWSPCYDKKHYTKLLGLYNGFVCINKDCPEEKILTLIEDLKTLEVRVEKTDVRYHADRFYYSPSAWNYVNYKCNGQIELAPNAESTLKGDGKRGGLKYFVDTDSCPDSIPNLHISQLNKYFVTNKNKCADSYAYANKWRVPNSFVFDIINKLRVYIITEKDKGFMVNCHWIKVPESYPKSDSRESRSPSTEFLGVYIPQQKECPPHGCIIFIWIDRIKECAESIMKRDYSNSPNEKLAVKLLFQMVLIHEFFHAIFDLQWDGKNYESTRGHHCRPQYKSEYSNINEETIDNTFVLMLYRMYASNPSFEFIYNFIKDQPKFYNEATKLFTRSGWLKDELRKLLSYKLRGHSIAVFNSKI
jgi:hypothetical protein